jgi:hypothetical protein
MELTGKRKDDFRRFNTTKIAANEMYNSIT